MTSLMAQWARQAHRLDGLPDLKVQQLDRRVVTVPAAKPNAKPIVAPPPTMDPDINGRNELNKLDRLDKLPGGVWLNGLKGLWLNKLNG